MQPQGDRQSPTSCSRRVSRIAIPTINHGKTRVDEMEVCGHYERWREDFDCVQEIGINYLRYGPPIHKI